MKQTTAMIFAVIFAFGAGAILWGHSDSAAVDAAGTRTMWLIIGWVLAAIAAGFLYYVASGNRFRSDD